MERSLWFPERRSGLSGKIILKDCNLFNNPVAALDDERNGSIPLICRVDTEIIALVCKDGIKYGLGQSEFKPRHTLVTDYICSQDRSAKFFKRDIGPISIIELDLSWISSVIKNSI